MSEESQGKDEAEAAAGAAKPEAPKPEAAKPEGSGNSYTVGQTRKPGMSRLSVSQTLGVSVPDLRSFGGHVGADLTVGGLWQKDQTLNNINSLLGIPSVSLTGDSLLGPLGILAEHSQTIASSISGITFRENSKAIIDSQENIARLIVELPSEKADKEKFKKISEELAEELEKSRMLASINFILKSVSSGLHKIVGNDITLLGQFSSREEIQAVVVSIDLRRSTELMLKAMEPSFFADFITELCSELAEIFKSNLGVVDKFTGDGLLAYFPEFFSGPDALLYALKAIKEANEAFATI